MQEYDRWNSLVLTELVESGTISLITNVYFITSLDHYSMTSSYFFLDFHFSLF